MIMAIPGQSSCTARTGRRTAQRQRSRTQSRTSVTCGYVERLSRDVQETGTAILTAVLIEFPSSWLWLGTRLGSARPRTKAPEVSGQPPGDRKGVPPIPSIFLHNEHTGFCGEIGVYIWGLHESRCGGIENRYRSSATTREQLDRALSLSSA